MSEQFQRLQEQPQPEPSWQQCLVNAEDCLIKAERDPQNRVAHIAEARLWNDRALDQG